MSDALGYENFSNEDLIEAFISTQRSSQTKKVYISELNKFNKFVGKQFKQVSITDMINFNKEITTKSDATRQRIHATIRAFFRWLVWAKVITEENNPAKGSFKSLTPKVDVASKSLMVDELEEFKRVAYPNSRDYAMVAVLFTTGVRISEMCNMKWSDLFRKKDPKAGTIDWYARVLGKGNKYRNVFLPEGTVNALIRLRNGNPIDTSEDTSVFTRFYKQQYGPITPFGARKRLEELAVQAGIHRPFTPHWFRHSFVSQALDSGANPVDVQHSAGHSSFRTTEKYMWALGRKVGNFLPVQF